MLKKFKLQPVLDYRLIREAEARQRLTEVCERESAIDRQLVISRDRLADLCIDLAERQRQGITVTDMMLHQARIQGVEARLKNLEKELESCRQEVADCRQKLCDAGRDKKLLERLKEKFSEERRQFQNRQETVLLDELSLNMGKGE